MLTHRIGFGAPASVPPNRLVHGDNAQVLPSLRSDSVDLIYIDPPFGTGTVRRGGRGDNGTALSYTDVPDDPAAFVTWLAPRLIESRRILAPRASLFVHLDYRAVHYVKVYLDSLFGRECFVNEIIWCYSVGGKSRRTFGRKHDTILWYAKQKDYAFYPDAVRVARRGGSHMRVVKGPDGTPVQEKTDRKTGKVYRYPVSAGKLPEDWWADIETLNRGAGERTGWPTQKPSRLLERVINAVTIPGDTVGDWFSGSGTTAAVAQSLGRRFVAVDASGEAIACAARRITEAAQTADSKSAPPDLIVEGPAAAMAASSAG